MKKHFFYFLFLTIFVTIGCQKETSFEGSNTPARGSLQAELTGDCLPKTVNGAFVAGTALVPANNTIAVQVNVARTGSYIVYTDTVNGYYFRATGTFTTLGLNTVTLQSNGTPFAAGVNNFVVNFDTTVCDIQVTVLPAGTVPATFTLVSGGTPVNCASAIVTGTYVKDAPLNPTAHYVDITVNVTVIGTYTIRATGGGMVFQKAGAFTTTGNATVRLDGQSTSTPTTVGANTVTFDPPFASCNFTVTVTAPVAGTLGGGPGACAPITVNNTPVITQGTALVAGNTVVVQITTPSASPYSITTAPAVAGLIFSASGTSTGGTQMITLTNNGAAPTASGVQTFTVKFGTSTCTFTINIAPAGGGNGAATPDCSTAVPSGLYEPTLQLNCSNTVDIAVNVTALGPFSVTTAVVNGMTFSWSGTFTTLGVQTITLVGSGTPVTATTSNITFPGAGSCTFPVIVTPPFGPIGWTINVTTPPAMTYKGQFDFGEIIPAPAPAVGIIFTFEGSNSDASDFFQFGINDISGTINVGETYSTSVIPPAANSAAAQYDSPGGVGCTNTFKADPTIAGATLVFTVTFHDAPNGIIRGTFTGTMKNIANQTINVNGSFDGLY